ncbi:Uncharacterised protein [Serratia entomophila]|uniref:hypothetical protein n=1 Tax=Serratia entomophila TaxID=42906 RepID=UPI00217BB64F|nr:hypothetical protein [Serratia entomophila]CAI1583867.1 Uncharacterised protein [Serratia entomophila]CAI2923266.1 Uncharacterised protein [Serratia entomophila]
MTPVSKYFPYILIVVVIVIGIFIVKKIKQINGKDNSLYNLMAQEKWSGQQAEATLLTFEQTDTRIGNDFIFDVVLNATPEGSPETLRAKALVKPVDLHRMKAGMSVTIKYDTATPRRVAVLAIHFE